MLNKTPRNKKYTPLLLIDVYSESPSIQINGIAAAKGTAMPMKPTSNATFKKG
jgi:hypothetical protein